MFYVDLERMKADSEFYYNERLFDSYMDDFVQLFPLALEDTSLYDKAVDRIYGLIYGEDINDYV